jgi:hypothetical protein
MNLRTISLITAVAIGIGRVHGLVAQFQLFAASNLSQSERLFPVFNSFLLLPLPILLFLIWSSQVKLRVSESSRALAVAAALALGLFSTLPNMYQLLAALTRESAGLQFGWQIMGLFAQFMAMLFLIGLAIQREEAAPLGMPAPYDPPSLRTIGAVTVWSTAIGIVVYVVVTALMFTDVYGSVGLRGGFLSARFFGFVPVVVSFVMAFIVYRSDPSKEKHYETSVAGGRG